MKVSNRPVRVRFAPSPTGPLHMGGMRTALFNFLFARKHNGTFILRIEDTDRSRLVKGAEQYIINSLEWCNLQVDEGVIAGGDFEPYRQSERKRIYKKHSDQLVAEGKAYLAFDTPEELELVRQEYARQQKTFTYGVHNRSRLHNSLTLSGEEVERKIHSGIPYAVRFKIPENIDLKFHDIIRGEIVVNTSTLDDKVLFKSDGMPTYHLANVVDDHLMKISHVIRGEEWLPSLPLHILLYQAFGWESTMPRFAHMPLTLKPDGKGKLSKRDGDRLGFPVFPLEWTNPETGEKSSGYRESGYFPEAFVNMLAFLGWNPGTEQEIFSMEELIESFTLERVVKAGSRFDPGKAKWFNHHYLQIKSTSELAEKYIETLAEKGIKAERTFVQQVVELVKERADFISDLWDHSFFFFQPPETYDRNVVKKWWKNETSLIMKELMTLLSDVDDFTASNTEIVVKEWIAGKELGMGEVMNVFRLFIVGALLGPHLFDVIEILGKEETLNRIRRGLKQIEGTT